MTLAERRPAKAIAEVVQLDSRRAAERFETAEELVAGLRARDRVAMGLFVDRYGPYVERILARIMGMDSELSDLLHDVFVNALGSMHTLRSPTSLREWLRGVTVFVARGCLRRRRRRRWLTFLRDEDLPDTVSYVVPSDTGEVMARLYRVLDRLPTEERIVFALRFIEQMELTEVADACGISRSTVKRRQSRAEALFLAEARKDPLLCEWIEDGSRWGIA